MFNTCLFDLIVTPEIQFIIGSNIIGSKLKHTTLSQLQKKLNIYNPVEPLIIRL